MILSDNLPLPMAITSEIRQTSFRLASSIPRGVKREKVFFSTIGVCILNDYLQWMSVPTDLKASDSYNPVSRLCSDAVDLEIQGLGRLECCTLKENEDSYLVPPEAWENRIGYVAVEVKSSFKEAAILGFCPTHKQGILHRQDLYPIEDLFDLLWNLTQGNLINQNTPVYNLKEWLEGVFPPEWQSIENLFPRESQPVLAWRSISPSMKIKRAKLIDLGMSLGNKQLALLVATAPETDECLTVRVQLMSDLDSYHLPPGISLSLFSQDNKKEYEARARFQDDLIRLPLFRVKSEELFSIEIAFNDKKIRQTFINGENQWYIF